MTQILGIAASQSLLKPVAGYSLWLDASDSSTFTFSSGSQVSQWRDKSANAYVFQQNTSASQPVLNGSKNSKTTLTFDGSNDTMTGTNTTGLNPTSWSLFIVGQGSGGATQTTIAKRGNSDSADDAWGAGFYNSKFYSRGRYLSSGSNATILDASGGLYIIQSNGSNGGVGSYIYTSSIMTNNSSTSVYFNGGNVASASAGSQSVTGAGQVTLGSLYQGSNLEFLSGNIAEILLYSSALGTTDRQSVENYLKAKWGF